MDEASSGAIGIDRHSADGVDRQSVSTQTAKSQRGEYLDGFGDVLQGLTPAGFVEHSIEIGGRRGCTFADQHLATSGERRDPRGQIDGRAE